MKYSNKKYKYKIEFNIQYYIAKILFSMYLVHIYNFSDSLHIYVDEVSPNGDTYN